MGKRRLTITELKKMGFKYGHLNGNDNQPELMNNGIIEICVDCIPVFETRTGEEFVHVDDLKKYLSKLNQSSFTA